jgi:hypothetical protein
MKYDSEAQTNMSLLGRKKKQDEILMSRINGAIGVPEKGQHPLNLSKILDQDTFPDEKRTQPNEEARRIPTSHANAPGEVMSRPADVNMKHKKQLSGGVIPQGPGDRYILEQHRNELMTSPQLGTADPFAEHNNSLKELSSIRPKFMMAHQQKSDTVSSINIFPLKYANEAGREAKDSHRTVNNNTNVLPMSEVGSPGPSPIDVRQRQSPEPVQQAEDVNKSLSYQSIMLEFENIQKSPMEQLRAIQQNQQPVSTQNNDKSLSLSLTLPDNGL